MKNQCGGSPKYRYIHGGSLTTKLAVKKHHGRTKK
jgi:hypothetical protein